MSHALTRLGVVHTIAGSLAASFAGEPRSTIDIDVVAALDALHVNPLVAALSGDFDVDEAGLRRALRERSRSILTHQSTQLEVALVIAGGTALDTQPTGAPAGRERGRRVQGIIRVQGPRLDREFFRQDVPAVGVDARLTDALVENE